MSDDHSVALRQTISEMTFAKEMDIDHPMCEKLALYTAAHRNYLASLTHDQIKNNKVNWGLKETKKLE